MIFTFDKSGIPHSKLNDPRLREEDRLLNLDMQSERYRLETGLHEAAHAIYMERAHTIPVLIGPTAFYENHCFSFSDACVRPDIGPGHTRDNLDMARWYAAGGVASRLLIGHEDRADSKDFQAFEEEMVEVGATDAEIASLWKQGKCDVESDLRSPEFVRQLWARAWDFKQQLENMQAKQPAQ